jgi:hypothetical protein
MTVTIALICCSILAFNIGFGAGALWKASH